jgi:hypothetical protein
MLCFLKSIAVWAVLMFISINLIGFVVRGILWSPPHIEVPSERMAELFRHETRRATLGSGAMTLLGILATAAYIFALFHFWNVWLAVAASVLMATRLPDLVWDIRTGKRLTRKNAPKGWIPGAAILINLATWPLIWYSLCKMP